MKQPYKKTLAVLAMASMVVLSSCGTVPTNEDPAAIMKEARTNLVSEITSSIDKDPSGSSSLNFDGTASANGMSVAFNGSTDTKSALENNSPSMSLLLKLNASVDAGALGKSTGAVELEIRQIAKMVYGNLMKAEANSDNAQLDAQIKQGLALVSLYSGKWFQLDQSVLEKMNGASGAVQAINKEEVKALVAELANHEIFTLEEKLAPVDGNYAYKVRLNADGIASLMKAISSKTDSGTSVTDADLAQIKSAVEAINNEKTITHTLYIDATTKKYKKFESKGTVEKNGNKTTVSSVIEAPKTDALKWSLAVDSTNTASNTSGSVKIDLSAMDGKMTGMISMNIPDSSSAVTATINLNGTYNKNKVTVEAPAGATDLTQMLGGMATAEPTSTGTTMMTDDMGTGAAMIENGMGE